MNLNPIKDEITKEEVEVCGICLYGIYIIFQTKIVLLILYNQFQWITSNLLIFSKMLITKFNNHSSENKIFKT